MTNASRWTRRDFLRTGAAAAAIPAFVSRMLRGERPTVYGDGEQSRDFTFVEDVADLTLRAARANGVSGRVYNGGNGNRYTLNQVWDTLQKIEGVSIPPTYGPPRPGDVRDSQADTTAAARDLGHSPRFTLEQGLRRTLEWYRRQG